MATLFQRLRDVLVRQSQIGKLKLDATFVRRERDALLMQLGETALQLLARGELSEHPALGELLAELRRLDERRERDLRQVDAIRTEFGPEPS